MKKILFLFVITILLASTNYAQKGSTATDTSTTGWSMPSTYTPHFSFPVYKLLSNPGGWINKTNYLIDAALYSTDSLISAMTTTSGYYINSNDFTVSGDSVQINSDTRPILNITNDSTLCPSGQLYIKSDGTVKRKY